MMVHQWWLRWLAIGWVLVPAAASRVRLGACASGVVDTLAMAAFSSETSPKSSSFCCGLLRTELMRLVYAGFQLSQTVQGHLPTPAVFLVCAPDLRGPDGHAHGEAPLPVEAREGRA